MTVVKPAQPRGVPTLASSLRRSKTLAAAWRLAPTILLGLSALFAAFTAALILRHHVLLPGYDEWDTIAEYREVLAGDFHIPDLFRQHNEHRLFFARLFFFADLAWFHGLGYLNVIACLLIQAGHAALLIAIQRAAWRDGPTRALFAALTLLCLFSLRQSGNFIWGFQIEFVGVYAAATLAFWTFVEALPCAGEPVAYRRLALPFLAIFLASFNMANGILSGAVCVLLALMARARWPSAVLTLGFTAAVAAFYFTGFTPGGQQLSLADALAHPLVLLRYANTYLGNITGTNIRVAGFLGTWGLIAAAAAFLVVLRDGVHHRPRLVLFGIIAFIVATTFVTSLGRAVLGVYQATENRYNTPTMVFWVSQITFWWSLAAERRAPMLRAAVLATAAIVAGCAVSGEFAEYNPVRNQARISRQAGDSLLSGFFDPVAFSFDNDYPWAIADLAEFLRRQRLSIFSLPDGLLLGQPLSRAGRIASEGACQGRIAQTFADPALGLGAARVQGEATRPGSGRGVKRVYLVDAGNRIVGYASGDQPNAAHLLWQGYAGGLPGSTLWAYADLGEAGLCGLGSGTISPAPPEPR